MTYLVKVVRRWALIAASIVGAVLIVGLVGFRAAGEEGPLFDVPVSGSEEPITPIPAPPPADPMKLALGERLFHDPRLSVSDSHSCATCHDLQTNGARAEPFGPEQSGLLDTLTVFNAALNFRLNWQGTFRTLQAQAEASLNNPKIMGASPDRVAQKLAADPEMYAAFQKAYASPPNRENILDAIAIFEQSLLTPHSRFDLWLMGDRTALSPAELEGYRTFKSLGCVSCHQGVNVGGNLFQRHGIFAPLASPLPEILRVPSLRNVATTAPYFHDGSAPTLDNAVRRMARAQLNVRLDDEQVASIVAFLNTLTGEYQGKQVKPPVARQ